MKIGLVGLGLIGGSFALGLKEKIENLEVLGVDQNTDHLFKAKELGIIDEISTLDEICRQVDVIILSIPVNAIRQVLPRILDQVNGNQLVVDFGSTKKAICDSVRHHSKRQHFVAAHPIAGTEYSGPQAAFKELFEEKVMITCEQELSGQNQLVVFNELCSHLDMKMRFMTAEVHDLHLAFVSHLSHITSFALSNTVLDKKDTESHIFDMAGSGFASTVRLAKSSPDMWAPIFQENKAHLLEGIDEYIAQLQSFKESLEDGNEEELRAFMQKANMIKETVDQLK